MNALKISLILLLGVFSTSCIKSGLEDLPVYKEAEIIDFDLEYRYTLTNENGIEYLAVKSLGGDVDIDTGSETVTVSPTVPEATDNFPESERQKVSLENIVAYAKLSPAAKITPLNGAPELGKPGDFSVQREYRVTAADGKTSRVWTIIVESLQK